MKNIIFEFIRPVVQEEMAYAEVDKISIKLKNTIFNLSNAHAVISTH